MLEFELDGREPSFWVSLRVFVDSRRCQPHDHEPVYILRLSDLLLPLTVLSWDLFIDMTLVLDSSELFVLSHSSGDMSWTSSDSHDHISESAPSSSIPSSSVQLQDFPGGRTEISATAIIDWEHIWELADRSCLEPDSIILRTQLDLLPPPLPDLDSDDPLRRPPDGHPQTRAAARVSNDIFSKGDVPANSANHDGSLLDFSQRIRRLWNSMNRKDGTAQTVNTVRDDLQAISKQIEEWIVASATPSHPHQQETEKHENTIRALEQVNADLSTRTSSLERELHNVKAMSETWKAEARNVQNMQEIAVSAFERCNALERENLQLKQAMHAFAEGSTSNTVKELRQIIGDLTRDLAQYKKRERALQAKETQLRSKENATIIEDMRKQTEDLKVRRLLKQP